MQVPLVFILNLTYDMLKPQIGYITKTQCITVVRRHADGQQGLGRLSFACTVLYDAHDEN